MGTYSKTLKCVNNECLYFVLCSINALIHGLRLLSDGFAIVLVSKTIFFRF